MRNEPTNAPWGHFFKLLLNMSPRRPSANHNSVILRVVLERIKCTHTENYILCRARTHPAASDGEVQTGSVEVWYKLLQSRRIAGTQDDCRIPLFLSGPDL